MGSGCTRCSLKCINAHTYMEALSCRERHGCFSCSGSWACAYKRSCMYRGDIVCRIACLGPESCGASAAATAVLCLRCVHQGIMRLQLQLPAMGLLP